MNRRSILTKTGKGLMEATGKTSSLSRDLRNILKEIDGKVSVSELLEKFDKLGEPKLLEALTGMERDGYVREFVAKQEESRAPVGSGPISKSLGDGSDLDFTAFTPAKPDRKANEEARLQAQAQEIARQAQATRAREEATAKARAEAAAAARARADAEQRAKQAAVTRTGAHTPLPPLINPTVAPPASPPVAGILGAGPEAAARAQADAQAKAQAEALARARREAEEKARRDAEEKARKEAEARAKAELEAAMKREAEERALREIRERTRREEEEKARREAEARARLEAEQRAKREAEERARRELEERTRREVEERIRREEAERRRREEEERARREAEERDRRRREEEERVRREVEKQARIEAETRARVDAELRVKREAEERVRREAEDRRQEQLRKRAEDETRKRHDADAAAALERSLREAQEKAQREEEEKTRREEEEQALRDEQEQREQEDSDILESEEDERRKEERQAKEEERRAREEVRAEARAAARMRKAERARDRAGEEAWRGDEDALRGDAGSLSAAEVWEQRKPRSIAKTLAVMLLVLLVAGVAVLPFVPLDAGPYEKSAQAWLDQPVKIGTVNLTLLPLPQLKFEKVIIGRDPQMRVALIKASPDLSTLLEDQILLRSLELSNVTLPREFLGALLQDRSGRKGLGVQRVTAKGLKIDAPELGLPPLDLDASLSSAGELRSVALSSSENGLAVKLEPQGGKVAVEISANALPLPLGVDFGLTDFQAKGSATAGELSLNPVEGHAFGGRLIGSVRLRWGSGWSLDGDLTARQMDATKIAGPLLGGGTVQGKGTLSMKGLLPERMILNSQLDGSFTVQKGAISNVDMTRLLQGSGSGGGTTPFSELSGDFSADPNRLLVRNLKLAAGLLNGVGQVEMDPQKNLSGRIQIELRAQSVQARSTIGVTGTLMNPQFRRNN